MLDGEIVIANDGGLDFEALQLRIHPAASRVKLLSQQIPASVVFFDLLCEGDRDLRGDPFAAAARELESLLASGGAADPSDSCNARLERRGGLVSAGSRARVSTGSWPSRSRASTSRTSA